MRQIVRACVLALVVGMVGVVPAAGAEPPPDAVLQGDAVSVVVTASPFALEVRDAGSGAVLRQYDGTGPTAAGTLGFQSSAAGAPARRPRGIGPILPDGVPFGEVDAPSVGWMHATEATSLEVADGVLTATLATTDPTGRQVALEVEPAGEGSIRLRAQVVGSTADVEAVGVAFRAAQGERFLGFGERNDVAGRTSGVVEHVVGEGPYQREEYPFLQPSIIPAWGARQRADATYFPIPWLLSSRGYGVLAEDDAVAEHRLRADADDAWSVEVLATQFSLVVHTGPTPADALRRFVRDVGHQPTPEPWFYGPWFQPFTNFTTDLDTQLAQVATLRDADAPVSAVEMTHRYLPCGQQRGAEDDIRARTSAMHDRGLAVLGYLNPILCTSYDAVWDEAVETGALQRRAVDGEPYVFNSYVGAQDVPVELVGHLDLSTAAGAAIFSGEVDQLLRDGNDGWMEDFGEYTPFDAVSGDGTPGAELHNRFARDYHCAAHEDAVARGLRPGRFVRSGWTGSAACSPMVWSGDPTVGWGFDGLASQVTSALSAGTSGISMWSSDTGGFFALGLNELSEELLARWVGFSTWTPTLRTRVDGVAVPPKDRPQVFTDPVLPLFRKGASLHQQLLPYLEAATSTYETTGMPVMRHHVLTHPDDGALVSRDDQYMLGPDLLVAPVVDEGTTTRSLRLPTGDWVELERSWRFDPDGEGGLALTTPRVHAGGGELTVDAPVDEVPVFARRGALLPLLSREVDSTAPSRAEGVVHASDREDVRELLAFPAGSTVAAFGADGESLRSIEGQRSWTLEVDQQRPRTWLVQATLATLEEPFTPCTVTVDGALLPSDAWTHDAATGVLTADAGFDRNGTLVARSCQASPAGPAHDGGRGLPATGGSGVLAALLLLAVGGALRR